MIYEIKDTNKISPLFGHWEETLIWSCLQGIMGKIYANDLTAERLHHEIYISDPRKTAPEKRKTVIRHPIKKA